MFTIDYDKKVALDNEDRALLEEMWKRCAARIILSTTLAGSGHPGGSLSSLHILLVLYSMIRHRAQGPRWGERDRVLISMGHISPGVYSVLAEFGYISEEAFLTEFRRAGSPCAGHVEQAVPGVEWNTGNLGQGLSAGSAMALAQKLKGQEQARTFVVMGDGEQQKGQVGEARRFAVKYGLSNLVAIVDRNHLQIGGSTEEVMPVKVREEYQVAGWNVVYCPNGNDFELAYKALRAAILKEDLEESLPTVVVSRTVMGYGISFMEGKARYHGSPLKKDDAKKALEEIGADTRLLDQWAKRREGKSIKATHCSCPPVSYPAIDTGDPRLYGPDDLTDCRSAYGNVLKDLAALNNNGQVPRILGVSCDLEGSVKMGGFHKVSPGAFFEAGIQEHHAAVLAGALSREGFSVFFSTFGVFAVAETYNQQRLNDLNGTQVKIVATHLGLDVGEDGPTHQSIDYVGLLRNLFGFSIFIPADPNQTDRIVRYVAGQPGNAFVGMGRSKLPIILKEDGTPFFDQGYEFEPGRADWIRRGKKATIVAYGSVMPEVMEAWRLLKEEGLDVGVLNMASLKPVDRAALIEAGGLGPVVTVEDHIPGTGLGGIAAKVFVEEGVLPPGFKAIGVKCYGSSGAPKDLYRMEGLDARSIMESVKAICSA